MLKRNLLHCTPDRHLINGLMLRFGNKPYVDIRASFNSLIPNDISKNLKNKLIKFYFNKLEKHPYFHDKIEFEILFSCFDLTLDSRLQELESYNFSKKDIDILKTLKLKISAKIS